MSSRSILFAVLGLTLSGCAVSDDGRYYGGYYGGSSYNVQRYEVYPTYPTYRVYRYEDDRRYNWHHDRYQERRHHHYAPGYDGRYGWQGHDRRHDRRDEHRGHEHARPIPNVHGYKPSRHDDNRYQQREYGRNQALSLPKPGKHYEIQREDRSRHQQRYDEREVRRERN